MSATSVAKIYKSVIEDVITGVKDAFLDEGVDEQVLLELRQIWEKKLQESKAIEPIEPPAPVVKVTQAKQEPGMTTVTPTIHIQRNPPGGVGGPLTIGHHGHVIQSTAAPQIVHYGAPGTQNLTIRLPQAQPGTTLTLPPEVAASLLQTGSGTLSMAQVQALQNAVMARQQMAKSTGQAQYTITVPCQVPQGHPGQPQVVQAGPLQNMAQAHGSGQQQGQPQVQQVRIIKMPGQVDGAALDSSSDDDSSDDERINDDDDKDDLDDEDDEANDEVDEEPLNSNDDVSDEEVSEVQEIDNVVVCQYDKISRSRNRWKFHFKDGIMNIQGRDYVFQKSVGDAEW